MLSIVSEFQPDLGVLKFLWSDRVLPLGNLRAPEVACSRRLSEICNTILNTTVLPTGAISSVLQVFAKPLLGLLTGFP